MAAVAVETDRADNAGMAGNRPPVSNIFVAVAVGFALFIVAIIARNFWLSLALGIAGGIALAYAVFLLREYRMGLSREDKDAP